MIYCFLYILDWTFKANAGIGGHLTDVNQEKKYLFGRVLYDNMFNVFVVIILVQIVAGIIIDTFGSLREKENERN
jgi:hypothetical protein